MLRGALRHAKLLGSLLLGWNSAKNAVRAFHFCGALRKPRSDGLPRVRHVYGNRRCAPGFRMQQTVCSKITPSQQKGDNVPHRQNPPFDRLRSPHTCAP